MSTFSYTAKIDPQKSITGQIDAESEQDATSKLAQMGYFPVSITNEDARLMSSGGRLLTKIPRKELVQFTSSLATLIGSGVNIINSLKIISDQTNNKVFRAVIADITAKIKDGKPLSESVGSYPTLFSGLYIALIRSGEASGSLEETLKRLSEFTEKDEGFRSAVKSALTYPFFIFIVGTLTILVLLTFVIPRMVGMFDDMGQVLPAPTQLLITVSGALKHYWWMILATAIGVFFTIQRALTTTQGRFLFDTMKLKVPLVSDIILKTEISNLMRTLSILLSSGIPIIESLDISESVIQNQLIKREIQKFKELISSGTGLSACLKGSGLFPAFATNIVSVGEETGTMERSLLQIANNYEKEIDQTLKALTQLLEPVIILCMGLVVGFIVIAMLLPIFQINIMVQ